MKTKTKKIISSTLITLVALMTIVGLSDLIFLSKPKPSQINQDEIKKEAAMEKVILTTSDSKKITGDYSKADRSNFNEPKGWVVFLHMMPATKESWLDLAKDLQEIGYDSIAIDLRGHGESDGGPSGYLSFSDNEHQKSILDVKAAVEFLMQEGAKNDKIILIGASIGANLSLEYLAENPEIKTAILLSPGLNYRGIKTEPLAANLKTGQKVFFASSKDDGFNSEETKEIYDKVLGGAEKEIKIYDSGGHGTNILKNQPKLKELIIDFIKITNFHQ